MKSEDLTDILGAPEKEGCIKAREKMELRA